MIKSLFDLHLIDTIAKIPSYSKSKLIDVSTDAKAKLSFDLLIELGTSKYGNKFYIELGNKRNVKGHKDFIELLSNDDFISMLKCDSIGKSALAKIKLPSAARTKNEMKAIKEKYKDNILLDLHEAEACDNIYVVRTQYGTGPVVFITGINADCDRHDIRRLYAYEYKINYFQVRECSYEHWVNHPETQESTT
jgi:hypothetical protein